jgi:hypothetical protein
MRATEITLPRPRRSISIGSCSQRAPSSRSRSRTGCSFAAGAPGPFRFAPPLLNAFAAPQRELVFVGFSSVGRLADRLGWMAVDLFAGIPVGDYQRALAWYERLLGSEPSFLPNATEAVWELADHRFVFIEERSEHAGHAMHTIFVDNLDARVEEITERGIESAARETYSNGVQKVTYRDPDGNEIGFGGGPAVEA